MTHTYTTDKRKIPHYEFDPSKQPHKNVRQDLKADHIERTEHRVTALYKCTSSSSWSDIWRHYTRWRRRHCHCGHFWKKTFDSLFYLTSVTRASNLADSWTASAAAILAAVPHETNKHEKYNEFCVHVTLHPPMLMIWSTCVILIGSVFVVISSSRHRFPGREHNSVSLHV